MLIGHHESHDNRRQKNPVGMKCVTMVLPVFLPVLLFSILTSVSISSEAANESQQRDKNIEELMVLSGIDAFIKQLPALVNAGYAILEQSPQVLTAEQFKEVERVISTVFAYESLRTELVRQFKKHYDALRFRQVAELFHSPLAQRMTEYEQALKTPQATESLTQYSNMLEKKPPPQIRVDYVAQLDNASYSTQLTLLLQMHIIKNILLAASTSSDNDKALSRVEINATLEAVNKKISQQIHELVLVSFLYTYRDVSNTDLQQYINFYNNDNLQWFLKLYISSMEKILNSVPVNIAVLLRDK